MEQSLEQSIEIALENELKERDFYLQHSRRTRNALGKQMFARIAEDEDEHYKRLKDIHAELSRRGAWPEHISPAAATTVKEVLARVAQRADKTASADADDVAAVKTAIAFETKGYTFYAGLRDKASNQAERDFFDRLASIENEHLRSLKESLLFFEDPATWYEEHEKPHFEA